MKSALLLGTFTIIVSAGAFAAPTRTTVTFEATAKAVAGRHIMAKPKGGLILGSTVMEGKTIFTLVDLNGGTLQNGDAVQVTFPSGEHDTYWSEGGKKVGRNGDKSKATTFKVVWKVKNQTLQLRTPSGKYVAGTGKGDDIATIAKPADITVFKFIKNPKKPEKKK